MLLLLKRMLSLVGLEVEKMSAHKKKKKQEKHEKKLKKLMRKYYEENRDGYWEGVIANAKDEGIAEGIAIGEAKAKAEAKAEGKAEGKAEERKNLLAAARKLLAEGMDRLKVQHYTQLTDAEMASICEVN